MKSKVLKRSLLMLMSLNLGLLASCSIQGETGAAGKDGINGVDGKDGSQIYTGEGYPDNSLGKTGDIYIDAENGNLYSKSEDGYWITVGNIKGEAGTDGKDGETITIVSVSQTSNGKVDTYTITYSDGSSYSFTVTNGTDGKTGAQGQKGEDGHTPTITIGTNGNWFVDGQDTGYTATGPKGDTGSNGTDGKDGVSISKVERTDGDGTQGTYDTYTIYYSDGSTSTFKLYNAKDGADGHTPTITIGSNGNWYVDGTDTGVAATGEKGDKGDTGAAGKDGINGVDGKDGVSVSSISKTSTDGNKDTYTIYYSDGTTSIFVVTNGTDGIQGIQGEKGSDGHTPTITIGSNGNWYVDGTDTGVTAKGDKGDTGADGKDGVSVKNAYIDDNGDLICEMSDGSTINAGKVKDTTKHTVNFYVDDDLVQTVSVSDGGKVSAPSSDVTAGYTVNYWNSKEDGGYKWLFSAYTVTSDIDLYADFTYNDYTITYVDSKYNTVIDSLSVTYDKSYTLSKIDNQTGWTFSGWKDSDGNSFANFGTYRIANDLTIYANWVANQYTITLNPNNGIVSSTTVTATYDSTYELPTPTRTNYVFLGWYDFNDKKVSSKATWKGTENVTYTAKWTNIQNTYNFDAGDGTCETYSMQIDWEDAYELPTPTPADGYYFYGWYLNDTKIPQSGDCWTYSNAGGTLVAKYINCIPSIDETSKTVTYGLYPQTYVSDTALLSNLNTLTTPESNGWYLYNDEYYAKLTAKPYDSSYTFDDGTTIVSGTTYWFKCEPITWKMLKSNNGEYKLLSEVLLDTHCYYSSTSIRTIDSKTIYPNNYKYSDIRSWLNNKFYNTAFLVNSYIQTTEVDNSASTTGTSRNSYACENTNDKVYLLSYKDYLKTEYGFSTSSTSSTTRECKTTDYARANGASCDTSSSYKNSGYYWTRSPYYSDSISAYFIYRGGYLNDYYYVYYTSLSVRPSITIKL